jgi:hypothetical protein
MGLAILKYVLIVLNILLYSQTELEDPSKEFAQSCSKLLKEKYPEKPDPEIFTKMMLSCFIKITQSQSEKISNSRPLDDEEIDLLFDMDYLNQKSEEELKQKTDLMNKFLKEIQNPKHNLRKLVDVDDDIMDQNPDKDLNATIDDDDNKEDDDDDDDDFNDVDYNDTNYYGDDDDDEDMNDTEMYDDYYKDYYDDDYYGDEYWKNGNYDFGNMSDEDYEKMYGGDNNDYNYNYNENQSYKEMFMENKFACIFIICLIIMVILIAIFGKDFEDTQTLEIDPNKNKQQ